MFNRLLMVLVVWGLSPIVPAFGQFSIPTTPNYVTSDSCAVGWPSCPLEDATPSGEGWVCDPLALSWWPILGGRPSSPSGGTETVPWRCTTHIAFGQVQRAGFAAGEEFQVDVVAAPPDVVCDEFPSACRGQGSVILDTTTVGEAAVCEVPGGITSDSHLVVTPRGLANLTCFLQDRNPWHGAADLAISPRHPTSADVVEFRWKGGDPEAEEALRVITDNSTSGLTDTFYAVLPWPWAPGTFKLGVLTPGTYHFELHGCPTASSSEPIARLAFRVGPGSAPRSGRLELAVDGSGPATGSEIVERLNPSLEDYPWAAAVLFHPGLEETYIGELMSAPEVQDVTLPMIGSAPECRPPFPVTSPGRLGVTFNSLLPDYEARAEFVRRLLPELERETIGEGGTRSLVIRVPLGFEGFFLEEYLDQPEVLDGRVLEVEAAGRRAVSPGRAW